MDKKVINGIRSLSIDMINEARSGHPGICLSMAPTMYTLFSRHLNFNVNKPLWINRDRFILSAGHASALLYSTLFYAGYDINLNELKNFRKINSIITGHPEYNPSIGVEATTGALGSGVGIGVGFSIAEEYLRNNIGEKIINYYTYVLVSDGDLMEGISYEAASFAGSTKLSKLILLYDSNNISLDGSTKNVFDEDVLKRFSSLGWSTFEVNDGENIKLIDEAITKAKKSNTPSIIKINTILGKYSKNEGTNLVHGKPLTEEDIISIKAKLDVNPSPFHISKDPVLYFRAKVDERVKLKYKVWEERYKEALKENSILKLLKKEEKIDLSSIDLSSCDEELRITNSKILNLICDYSPLYLCGSADVKTSTKVEYYDSANFNSSKNQRNIMYGVRESLMSFASIGIALSGLRPIISTFLTFSDYMKPGIRNACLMNADITYVFTHDSISIGEDGPTHQPIEQLTSLRSIPNLTVIRPCDEKEIIGSLNYTINTHKPVALIISKDKVGVTVDSSISLVKKGAYIIRKEKGNLVGIIISSGTDTQTCIKVYDVLRKKGIFVRVISMPSINIFNEQTKEYKESIIPKGVKTIVVESSNDTTYLDLVYSKKYLLNLNTFGKCGDKESVLRYFELDEENLVRRIENLLK